MEVRPAERKPALTVPLHTQKDDSFTVSVEKQDLLFKRRGISFMPAMRFCASPELWLEEHPSSKYSQEAAGAGAAQTAIHSERSH